VGPAPSDATRALLGWGTRPGTWQQLAGRAAAAGFDLRALPLHQFCDLVYARLADAADRVGPQDREKLARTLGVDGGPDASGYRGPTPRPPRPVEPGAPAWWTGENPDAFLAQMGVVLE
jgi:hypothetical protein